MIDNQQNIAPCKTLQDIIDKDILEKKALEHWSEISTAQKKKRGYKYNKVISNSWNIREEFNWLDEYFALDEIQKRMLLKRELINAYNALNGEDRKLFNSYLEIDETISSWLKLRTKDKQKIFKAIFNFY